MTNSVGDENLRHKSPSQSPLSPSFLDTVKMEDTKPKPPTDLKLVSPPAALQPRPPSAASPPLLSQPRSGSSPPAANIIPPNSSPPLLISPDQSVDDIRQRLTATLERRKAGGTSPKPVVPPRPSPFWSDDASVYSDTDMLDDVLSQGSVNDLLSAVGDGFAVYEDITGLPDSSNNNPHPADAVYGDASYASCYSNLEFVMGQARAAAVVASSSVTNTDDCTAKLGTPPSLPPKKNPRGSTIRDDDFGEYGSPSGQPIHANKAALLLERGFRVGGGAERNSHQSPSNDHSADNALYYDPGGRIQAPLGSASECDELEDMWDDTSSQPQELTCEQLPRTVLDLFV